MWARIFHRLGRRFGKLTAGGALILLAVAALLAAGIYRLIY
ncbi:hypothetical protein [Paenibacillus arenilitoris]|nr:hypothetical protein [Paenibacillus arenilitoris]